MAEYKHNIKNQGITVVLCPQGENAHEDLEAAMKGKVDRKYMIHGYLQNYYFHKSRCRICRYEGREK